MLPSFNVSVDGVHCQATTCDDTNMTAVAATTKMRILTLMILSFSVDGRCGRNGGDVDDVVVATTSGNDSRIYASLFRVRRNICLAEWQLHTGISHGGLIIQHAAFNRKSLLHLNVSGFGNSLVEYIWSCWWIIVNRHIDRKVCRMIERNSFGEMQPYSSASVSWIALHNYFNAFPN